MKKYIVLLVVLISNLSFSQVANDYKYAIVPSKFSFLKDKDQYRLNTLTKMLMEKYGFVTFFDTDILPAEVALNNCNKVYVEVQSNGNMLMTKITVILKDCKNNVLFTSVEGNSREKEYQVAYNVALREAFDSFNLLRHEHKEMSNINKINSFINDENLNDIALFAQPIENGFQLIDPTTKAILKIYKTSNSTCFIANKNNIQGVLISKDNQWLFEFVIDSKFFSEKVEVKF